MRDNTVPGQTGSLMDEDTPAWEAVPMTVALAARESAMAVASEAGATVIEAGVTRYAGEYALIVSLEPLSDGVEKLPRRVDGVVVLWNVVQPGQTSPGASRAHPVSVPASLVTQALGGLPKPTPAMSEYISRLINVVVDDKTPPVSFSDFMASV